MNPLRQTLPLLALSAAVVLAGCAAMSQEECRTADWGEQGMRDALDGYPRSRLADIREACAKAGVAPIESLYWNGWNAGIAHRIAVLERLECGHHALLHPGKRRTLGT